MERPGDVGRVGTNNFWVAYKALLKGLYRLFKGNVERILQFVIEKAFPHFVVSLKDIR